MGHDCLFKGENGFFRYLSKTLAAIAKVFLKVVVFTKKQFVELKSSSTNSVKLNEKKHYFQHYDAIISQQKSF